MNEKLSSRREAASVEYEQTKQYQAMQYLNQVGVVKRVNQIGLFHGRDGDGTGGWQVDPDFDNSDNNTGHHNINKRSALNTSDLGTAHEFSVARSQGTTAVAEIYHIISEDPDAAIIDEDNFARLTRSQKANVNKAIAATLIGVTNGAPLSFEERHALDRYKKKDFQNQYGLMFSEEVGQFSQKLGLSSNVTGHVGSTINTIEFLKTGHLQELCNAFMDKKPSIITSAGDGRIHAAPINHEYLANWFRKNHIVGYKRKVQSATLRGQHIDNYMLFDLEKVNTEQEIEKRQRERDQQYSEIDSAIKRHKDKSPNYFANYLSKNLYISPRDIVKLAKLTKGFKEVFESDTGNWEKFKLEEHTETVLRVFDDNYADYLPASVIPLMRMALLVHDLGKPEAARNQDKANQKQYNLFYADKFLKSNNVSIDEPTAKLIKTMIGEGMKWTERWMIRRDRSSGTQFYDFCARTMKEYLGTNRVNQKTIFAFRNMLEILQTCDSAAYTTMAVTRSADGIVYRNYGSFNDTFKPNGKPDSFQRLIGRRARIKD